MCGQWLQSLIYDHFYQNENKSDAFFGEEEIHE